MKELNWYKTLTIDQKINLKDCCSILIGITWEEMELLFSMLERIKILYNKLKLEGFYI